jgi:hypothetical protein
MALAVFRPRFLVDIKRLIHHSGELLAAGTFLPARSRQRYYSARCV